MRTLTILSLSLAATLLTPIVSEAEVLRVTIEGVSLRDQPTTSSRAVATLSRGMLLDVVVTEGYWNRVRVQSTGVVGYIHSAFVEVDAPRTVERSPTPRNPSPPRSQSPSRRSETGYPDVGSFGLGGYLWSGVANVALSPVIDFSETTSLLGTFDTVNVLGTRIYAVTGNLLYRFPLRGNSAPLTFEPYLGGGAAFFSLGDWNSKGFTIVGGTFLRFESLPHLKFSGGFLHAETWGGDEFGFGSSFSFGGSTLMVGAHYYF